MMLLILVMLLGLLGPTEAIRGGTLAQQGLYPFAVAWVNPSGQIFCAGSLITDTHVLTAASCFADISTSILTYKNRDGTALIGSNDLRQISNFRSYTLANVFIHPSWTVKNRQNSPWSLVNLAVAQLASNVIFTTAQDGFPIVLASGTSVGLISTPGQSAYVVGWGDTQGSSSPLYSSTLQQLNVIVDDVSDCLSEYPTQFDPTTMLCVDPGFQNGACQGDTGAPLIANAVLNNAPSTPTPSPTIFAIRGPNKRAYQIGMFIGQQNGELCGENFPQHDLYINVDVFGPWIQAQTNVVLPFRYPLDVVNPPTRSPTIAPSTLPSCRGNGICGGISPSYACWCDRSCIFKGDCCTDFNQVCAAPVTGPVTGSCNVKGVCGYQSGTCWCDNNCLNNGDCCPDYSLFCGTQGQTANSCVGFCGGKGLGCWCDAACTTRRDCCPNVGICNNYNNGQGSCTNKCGLHSTNCWCDISCTSNGDCCPDYRSQCGPQGSCEGFCGTRNLASSSNGFCWCDTECYTRGDCCADIGTYCPQEPRMAKPTVPP